MDKKLRELERRVAASGGDPEAERRLWEERLRIGQVKKVWVDFRRPLYPERQRRGRAVTSDDPRPVNGLPWKSKHRKNRTYSGTLHYMWDGTVDVRGVVTHPVQPSILKSLCIEVDKPCSGEYLIEVYRNYTKDLLATVDLLTSVNLSSGVQKSYYGDLWVPVKRGGWLDVRIYGEQRSTFRVVVAMLEFWMQDRQ